MNLLPKDTKEFHQKEYWDTFFRSIINFTCSVSCTSCALFDVIFGQFLYASLFYASIIKAL